MDAPLRLTALGTPVDLHLSGPGAAEVRAALASRWELCARDEPCADARTVEVTCGAEVATERGSPRVGGTELAPLLVAVTHKITYAAIEAGAGSLLMLHAAGVCNPVTGAAVVCVAPGGTGKTTLVRTLAPGRGYLTDETVGVAADGTIVPYPKPLSVRRDGLETKDEVAPSAYGLAPATVTPYVAGIVLLDRTHDGPDVPEVAALDVFDAIISMTPETSSLARLPRPLHRLADLLEGLPLVARVRYREAASLGPLVSGLIGPVGAP